MFVNANVWNVYVWWLPAHVLKQILTKLFKIVLFSPSTLQKVPDEIVEHNSQNEAWL